MNIYTEEFPLGGGEGSVIFYYVRIGSCQIRIAESRAIIRNPVRKTWVSELEFLGYFNNSEDIKDAINDCNDGRFYRYIIAELTEMLRDSAEGE